MDDIMRIIFSKCLRDEAAGMIQAFPDIKFDISDDLKQALQKFPVGGIPVCDACYREHCDVMATELARYTYTCESLTWMYAGAIIKDINMWKDTDIKRLFDSNEFVRATLTLFVRYSIFEDVRYVDAHACILCEHSHVKPTDSNGFRYYEVCEELGAGGNVLYKVLRAGVRTPQANNEEQVDLDDEEETDSNDEEEIESDDEEEVDSDDEEEDESDNDVELAEAYGWDKLDEVTKDLMSGRDVGFVCEICGGSHYYRHECPWACGIEFPIAKSKREVLDEDMSQRHMCLHELHAVPPMLPKRDVRVPPLVYLPAVDTSNAVLKLVETGLQYPEVPEEADV